MGSARRFALLVAACAGAGGLANAHPATTTHEVLALEAEIFPDPAPRRQLLDSIIAEARRTIRPPTAGTREEALRILEAIDALLIARNFIYPGEGLVQHLSEALAPQKLSESAFEAALLSDHNRRRHDAMQRNRDGDFHVADCDLASFVYLAIGEALQLPIGFVEVPRHNFVRWTLPDGTHVNFETMDGVEQDDRYYRSVYAVRPANVRPGRHLVVLTRNEILGYMQRLRGVWWKKRGHWSKARSDYLEASRLRPVDPASHNNLAWLLATCPEASCQDGRLAIERAKVAVSLERDPDYIDTLACAYAAAGDFVQAERHSVEAVSLSGSSSLRENLESIRARRLCTPDETVPSLATARGPAAGQERLESLDLGNH